MQRVFFLLLGIGAFLVVTAAVLRPYFLPMAYPSPATPLPPVRVDAAPRFAHFAPALVDVRASVHVQFPPDWQSTVLDAATLGEYLADMQTSGNPELRPNATLMANGFGEDVAILTAVANNASNPALGTTLSVIAMKRNGLRLEQYLDETAALITSHGAEIKHAHVETTWRVDRLPVGVLQYSLPATALNQPFTPTDGLQVVTYSADGGRLVLFTFTTPAAPIAALSERFGGLVRSARFY
ncbi:MAG: hypothetical protein KJZ93_04795 [Caldilineaceae bacterium]|nr:hypothetical protein [Caldilineaceae bacterium]